MIKLMPIVLGIMLGYCSSAALASPLVEQETEHLLNYIENSGCLFIRNGSEYSSAEARSHIQRKYNHVKKKVDSTEQVIKYAATESSWSGKPYSIKCPEQDAVPSADWLSSELINYRNKHSQ